MNYYLAYVCGIGCGIGYRYFHADFAWQADEKLGCSSDSIVWVEQLA